MSLIAVLVVHRWCLGTIAIVGNNSAHSDPPHVAGLFGCSGLEICTSRYPRGRRSFASSARNGSVPAIAPLMPLDTALELSIGPGSARPGTSSIGSSGHEVDA